MPPSLGHFPVRRRSSLMPPKQKSYRTGDDVRANAAFRKRGRHPEKYGSFRLSARSSYDQTGSIELSFCRSSLMSLIHLFAFWPKIPFLENRII